MRGSSTDVALIRKTMSETKEAPTVSMPVAAEALIDLSRRLSASRYFDLLSRYTNEKAPIGSASGGIDAYKAVCAGNIELFKLHQSSNSGELYMHDTGDEGDEADGGSDGDTPPTQAPAGSMPTEQTHTIEMTTPTPGQAKALGPDAEAWECVRFITLAFPNQFNIAVRTCIREEIDPSALGHITKVIERAEGVDDDVWDALVELYEQSGLGLWPAVRAALRAETAQRETRSI
jgi:hypothetical protein